MNLKFLARFSIFRSNRTVEILSRMGQLVPSSLMERNMMEQSMMEQPVLNIPSMERMRSSCMGLERPMVRRTATSSVGTELKELVKGMSSCEMVQHGLVRMKA